MRFWLLIRGLVLLTLLGGAATARRRSASCDKDADCLFGYCYGGKCESSRGCIDDDCSLMCRNGGCCAKNETGEICKCDESKWTGELCEKAVLNCDRSSCSGRGNCTVTESELICSCDEGFTGHRCNISVLNLCMGNSKLDCVNGGICKNNSCNCPDGFGGTTCKNVVPLINEFVVAGCPKPKHCALRFADDQKDEECDIGSCFFDGTSSFMSDRDCLSRYGNRPCDSECNNAEAGFDGGDCTHLLPSRQICSYSSSQRYLRVVFDTSPRELAVDFRFLIAYIGQTLRAVVRVAEEESEEAITKTLTYEVDLDWRKRQIQQSDFDRQSGIGRTEVIFAVDFSPCSNNTEECLGKGDSQVAIQSSALLLSALFVRPQQNISFFGSNVHNLTYFSLLQVEVYEPSCDAPSFLSTGLLIASVLSLIFLLVFSALVLAFFRSRKSTVVEKRMVAADESSATWVRGDRSALIGVVERGDLAAFNLLLSSLTPIAAAEAEDSGGNTALHIAASRDDKVMVQSLLSSGLFDVCSVNSVGQCPLVYCMREGRPSLDTLTLLVNAMKEEKGRHTLASPSTATAYPGLSPLSEESGWSLTDSSGRSVLHYAALNGSTHLVHFLVSNGASPSLPDATGNTPLHLAAINGHVSTVAALLQERASCTFTNSLGHTPAQVCLMNGHSALATLLMERENAVSSPSIVHPRPPPRAHSLLTTLIDETSSPGRFSPSILPSLSEVDTPLIERRYSLDEDEITPKGNLPSILTPIAHIVTGDEVLPQSSPFTLPRKWVERSESDSRGTQPGLAGKRRSVPGDTDATHFIFPSQQLTTTLSNHSNSTATSNAHHSNLSYVSSFRP